MSSSRDVVVLLPGFLGFEQIGGFYYFADRVSATIRGVLAARGHRDVTVVPATTLPSEHLAERQKQLMLTLARLQAAFEDVAGFHLVGHSTGGTDALLALGEEPIAERVTWSRLDPGGLRLKIRTVVAIGSPHHGSCITTGALARFFLSPLGNLLDLGSIARATVYLNAAVWMDSMARGIIAGALWDRHAAQRYILDVVSARGLVSDLRPAHMVALHRRFQPDLTGVCFRSFVTMAGRPAERPDENPDRLFEYLYQQTGGQAGCCGGGDEDEARGRQTLERLLKAIEDEDILIQNPDARPRAMAPEINDGIVNSARQLYDADSEEELAGVVVGDHFDVLGYYPYAGDLIPVDSREPRQAGILHSGSRFTDDEFFELYARVAGVIAGQLEKPMRRRAALRAVG